MFSISDINNASPDGFLPEDDMVDNESEEDDEAVSFPVRASVTIEKVKHKRERVLESVYSSSENDRMVKVLSPLTPLLKMVKLPLKVSCITRTVN